LFVAFEFGKIIKIIIICSGVVVIIIIIIISSIANRRKNKAYTRHLLVTL